MKVLLPAIIILAVSFTACFYDNEEALYPSISDSCDTTSVTFSTTITALLVNNCYTCHSNSAAPTFGNGIALEDYQDVADQAERVLASIRHESGYSPMPKGGGSLNDCLIKEMEAWVNQGSPAN